MFVWSHDPNIIQEPHVYRMNEAVLHYGESIKKIVNEKFGDGLSIPKCLVCVLWIFSGIMSAIDFYMSVDKVKGVHNEDRVVITMNGKFLPHVEQLSESDTSK